MKLSYPCLDNCWLLSLLFFSLPQIDTPVVLCGPGQSRPSLCLRVQEGTQSGSQFLWCCLHWLPPPWYLSLQKLRFCLLHTLPSFNQFPVALCRHSQPYLEPSFCPPPAKIKFTVICRFDEYSKDACWHMHWRPGGTTCPGPRCSGGWKVWKSSEPFKDRGISGYKRACSLMVKASGGIDARRNAWLNLRQVFSAPALDSMSVCSACYWLPHVPFLEHSAFSESR